MATLSPYKKLSGQPMLFLETYSYSNVQTIKLICNDNHGNKYLIIENMYIIVSKTRGNGYAIRIASILKR